MEISLTPEEQRAADAILEVVAALRALSPDGAPANFSNEAIPAIHTLQMFVLMHWAHRIHPDYWSNWYMSLSK